MTIKYYQDLSKSGIPWVLEVTQDGKKEISIIDTWEELQDEIAAILILGWL